MFLWHIFFALGGYLDNFHLSQSAPNLAPYDLAISETSDELGGIDM